MAGTPAALDFGSSELVLGLVSPVGTDLSAIQGSLVEHFRTFSYDVKTIKLSSFLDRLSPKSLGVKVVARPEFDRIRTHMDAGDALRTRGGRGDLLALHAAREIALSRQRTDAGPRPLERTVHILHSLKNPDEVTVLRRIYGPGFFLIAVYASEKERLAALARKGMTEDEAQTLIDRDRADNSPFGQQTRDTFHLADAFVPVGDDGAEQLRRFIDLVFGHPYHTPTPDENAMFMAFSASLRSGDLSRQVGAVVVSKEGELIAAGANDVPRAGGGLYWPGPDDERDWVKGVDSNRQQIREIARDTLTHLHGKQPTPKELDRSIEKLRGARLFDLTECGRAVHAEMEALSACARVGVSPRGGTLFTTTFPCHNCAKHLIAAGISRVVYVEPYPKSRALQLHDDALSLEERDGPSHEKPDDVHSTKVRLVPFIGIGARRYFDLFSMRLGFGEPKKRAIDGRVMPWNPSSLRPRAGMSAASYLQRERMAAAELQHVVPKQPRRRSYARSKK